MLYSDWPQNQICLVPIFWNFDFLSSFEFSVLHFFSKKRKLRFIQSGQGLTKTKATWQEASSVIYNSLVTLLYVHRHWARYIEVYIFEMRRCLTVGHPKKLDPVFGLRYPPGSFRGPPGDATRLALCSTNNTSLTSHNSHGLWDSYGTIRVILEQVDLSTKEDTPDLWSGGLTLHMWPWAQRC